jgi:hypothetical protein
MALRSHLDTAGGQPKRQRQVFTGDEVDRQRGGGRTFAQTVHGRVVDRDSIRREDHNAYGGHVVSSDMPRDARERYYNTRYLPNEARHWVGSDCIFSDRELPANDFAGMGFMGSEAIVSAKDLDDVDKMYGTSVQPLKPGAYMLQDGNVLIVGQEGQRAVISPAQYQQLQQQQRRITQGSAGGQPQTGARSGLIARVLRKAGGE